MSDPKQSRSGAELANLQEILDAASSPGQATMNYQQQYETPVTLAKFLAQFLPARSPWTVFDPQCAKGNLIDQAFRFSAVRFGFEIDNRMVDFCPQIKRITANCVKAWEVMDDCFPDLMFDCQVANPPFGILWKTPGSNTDSTEYTWRKLMERTAQGGYGYMIANYKTIERLKLHEHKWVYHYQKFPAGIWHNCDVEIGVVFWHNSDERMKLSFGPQFSETHDQLIWTADELNEIMSGGAPSRGVELRSLIRTNFADWVGPDIKPEVIAAAWVRIQDVLNEETRQRPPFNIYLGDKGMLRTYLSTRLQVKRKLSRNEILRIEKVNNCHPLALTVDRETRKLLAELVESKVYTIQPEAKESIAAALREMGSVACPIMPITDFESVAYADEEDTLLCVKTWRGFKKGKRYDLTTSTYEFRETFKRKKAHFSEMEGRMFTKEHDCTLTGQDRLIQIKDDCGQLHRFMERPDKTKTSDHEESMLWQIFERPKVKTVVDVFGDLVDRNKMYLRTAALLAGFTYYDGQLEYIARMGVKEYGLFGAATGTGKSLMALSMIQLKSPKRALIIAPQGTIRGGEDDDEDEDAGTEFGAAQWVQEIRRFAPGRPVFELFSLEDYQRIVKANGELPPGIYITYYQAMFSNGAREGIPESWNDLKLSIEIQRTLDVEQFTMPTMPAMPKGCDNTERYWCETIGTEKNGIRCIIKPCLSTLVGHEFDMICVDEAHVAANLDANLTQMLIRMQPKFRYAFTATPIPNIIANLFSVLGWLCVPGWHKGGIRNLAWPFAREELHRFCSSFMSKERDHTQEQMNKDATKARGKCEKVSSVISAPARLLKIIKPTMAYIGKSDCNPLYRPPKLVDIRVPMGRQQTRLYAYYLNRGNIPAKNPLVRARKQLSYLRNICADPHGFSVDRKLNGQVSAPSVNSNMNPKTMAVMELIRDIAKKGEPCVIISARLGQTQTYARLLSQCGFEYSRIDSTTGAEYQSHQANQFKKGQTQWMLMGIKCAAAWSFSECPNEIIGSIEYSPGPLDQAKGRIDRVNSKYLTTIYCLLHRNSYEETMFDLVATKDDAAKICLLGQRIPRDFKPVDMQEVFAETMINFKDAGEGIDEDICGKAMPDLIKAIRNMQVEAVA